MITFFTQICKIQVPDLPTYRRHFLIEHCQYVLQCQKCPVVFEDFDCAEKMLLHIKSHHSTDSNKSYSIQDDLNDTQMIPNEPFDIDEDINMKSEKVKKSLVSIVFYENYIPIYQHL